jgi:hypothetical protein
MSANGTKRTRRVAAVMSATDPKRTVLSAGQCIQLNQFRYLTPAMVL